MLTGLVARRAIDRLCVFVGVEALLFQGHDASFDIRLLKSIFWPQRTRRPSQCSA